MTDATIHAWESELKALLEKFRTHPSTDHTEDRQRAAVLEKLVADFYRNQG
ncbi:MAG TPA: hypothetical protein PLL48_05955 [Novosphingobium sp.]|jgi:hypothetical protein|nr:hypothetical protein [Novosphingobium sp.]